MNWDIDVTWGGAGVGKMHLQYFLCLRLVSFLATKLKRGKKLGESGGRNLPSLSNLTPS